MMSALFTGCSSDGQSSTSEQTEAIQGTASDGTEENSQSSNGTALEAVPGESIQTNGGEVIALSALEHEDANAETTVYYTSKISPEAMVAVYDALGVELTGDNIAVKLSTGEPPDSVPVRLCIIRWRKIMGLPILLIL